MGLILGLYHPGYGIEGEETVALGGMGDVTGFGEDLGSDIGAIEEFGGGFDEQQLGFSACLKIEALRFVESVVRVVGLGKTVLKEDDERIACFAEGAGDGLFSFGDSGSDIDRAVRGFCEAFCALLGDVLRGQAAGALEDGSLGHFGEEHIAKGSTDDSADGGLLMDPEEVRVRALEGKAAGIVVDIMDHGI